jgi:hypothetical protein
MTTIVTYSWCGMVSTDDNINRVLGQNKTGAHVVLATGDVQQEIMRLSDFKEE